MESAAVEVLEQQQQQDMMFAAVAPAPDATASRPAAVSAAVSAAVAALYAVPASACLAVAAQLLVRQLLKLDLLLAPPPLLLLLLLLMEYDCSTVHQSQACHQAS
jgi:hypothetical protein